MTKQSELDVGITDTSYRVSADGDRVVTYRCHKCTKRRGCTLRMPDKLEETWKIRKECKEFNEDKEWWT